MAPAKLYNLARMTTATTGAGTITLGTAVPGFLTFAQAGIVNGDVISYGITDGTSSEVGTGTYTASGTTLTRTVTKSTNSDAAIALSGTAEAFITIRSEDYVARGGDTLTGILTLANGTAAAPSLCFTAGAAYGLYWFGSAIGFSAGGAVRLSIGSTATSTVLWREPNGSAAAPSYSFTSGTGYGLYFATGQVSMASNGTEAMRWTGADNSTRVIGPLILQPAASVTPANNGDMVFQLTSDTQLAIKVKGSDGVVRSAALTLA